MIETARILSYLSQLVQIPSVGPENAGVRSGEPGEGQIADRLAAWFTALGGEVHREEVLPGRPNLYGIWHGTSDRWIAVDVHVDTVGVETMQVNPFDGRVADGRIYGRGAVDTKASLGIVLAGLEALQGSGRRLEANLLVCASMAEETGAIGAAAFAKWVRQMNLPLDQLLVAEPTLCAPVYGHKGTVGIELTIQGVAVHSSEPEKGANAIAAAADIIAAYVQEHRRLRALPPTSELGTPSLTVSMIEGGQAVNIVPDRCTIRLDRRLVLDEDPQAVTLALYELARDHCPLAVTMKPIHGLRGFFQNPASPWVQQLADWSGTAPGIVHYGTNACAYDGLANECVIFGPGSIEQAHRDIEWVEIAELEKAARIYEKWWGLA